MTNYFLVLLTTLYVLFSSCNKTDKPGKPVITNAEIEISVLTDKLSMPWELVWGPDNRIWMTEKSGRISRVDPSTGEVSLLIIIPDVIAKGEGGLLGMALHPDFTTAPQVFVILQL